METWLEVVDIQQKVEGFHLDPPPLAEATPAPRFAVRSSISFAPHAVASPVGSHRQLRFHRGVYLKYNKRLSSCQIKTNTVKAVTCRDAWWGSVVKICRLRFRAYSDAKRCIRRPLVSYSVERQGKTWSTAVRGRLRSSQKWSVGTDTGRAQPLSHGCVEQYPGSCRGSAWHDS